MRSDSMSDISPSHTVTCLYTLNFTFSIPKCLRYRIKGNDHNTQTRHYFYSILIYYNTVGYMFRLLIESSSGPQDTDPGLLLHCGIPNAYRTRCIHYRNIRISMFIYLYTCVRASWIELNNCPTRCNLFSLLHFCRQLYMFWVLTPIIRSWYSCNYSFWHWSTGSTQQRERMVVDPVNLYQKL